MKKIFCFFVPLMFTLFFVGCGANTGIVKISDDTYLAARQDGWSWSGSEIKLELYKEANEYCAKIGKKFVQVSNTAVDAKWGEYAGAEIQFKCQ